MPMWEKIMFMQEKIMDLYFYNNHLAPHNQLGNMAETCKNKLRPPLHSSGCQAWADKQHQRQAEITWINCSYKDKLAVYQWLIYWWVNTLLLISLHWKCIILLINFSQVFLAFGVLCVWVLLVGGGWKHFYYNHKSIWWQLTATTCKKW